MTYRLSFLALGLAGWLTASAVAADDVEVLGRGPVHDAFAEPSEREPVATPVIPKEPPKTIEELPPDQKPEGDNVQWISGYWAWDMDKKDFIWVSGFLAQCATGPYLDAGFVRKAADGWQWTGGFWAEAKAGKANIQYLPQPPAPLDVAGPTTPAPSETHIYVPGSWVYRDRYVWRPGYWCEHRPDWVWTSAHYRWTPGGYIFIDGYWDYPLNNRGMLFAPAYIPPVVYSAPDYVYTPSYVVREDCLFGAFFNRRGYGSYYFGDYFAPRYAGFGFSAWCGNGFGLSVSIGGGGYYDPLFSYYRCGFGSDPFWGGGIFNLYAGRYRGDYLCPPVNLVQQNTVINNITNVNNINNVNTNNVNMLTAMNKSGRKLEGVHQTSRKEHQQIAKVFREAADQRATTETQLATRPGAGGKTGAPTIAALDAPQRPPVKPSGIKTDPIVGVGPKPVAPGPVAPPPPTPVSPGRPVAKGTGTVVPKGDPGVGVAVPKGGNSPAIVPKGGSLPLPKGGSANPNPPVVPAPKGGSANPNPPVVPAPKGGSTNPNPPVVPAPKGGAAIPKPMLTPKVDVPRPKSVAIPPSSPPASAPSLKPPVSSPPVSVPKPQIAPRPSAPPPRPVAAPVRPAPSRPAAAPPSRPAPKPAAVGPAPKGKRGK